MARTEVVRLGLYSLMVDNLYRNHIVQGFQRQAITLFLMGKPYRKRLFDNPAPGAFQSGGHLVNFVSHR